MNKVFFLFLLTTRLASAQLKDKPIYTADFSRPLDNKVWVVEIESKPGAVSTVYTKSNALVLDTKGGVTVWLNRVLKGDIQIEYDRQILVDTGKNDRLSDFNQFWMASDPHNPDLFTRNGKFKAYDDLQLYYVGMGGNTNRTTRFRKYRGAGMKPIIKQYDDRPHLLQAGKVYHIKIIVYKGKTSYWVNGKCYFNWKDPLPLTSGYFGFRSTWSRQEIKNFKVLRIGN